MREAARREEEDMRNKEGNDNIYNNSIACNAVL